MFTILLFASLAACGDEDDDSGGDGGTDTGMLGGEDLADDLEQVGGCADIVLYAHSTDDTWLFSFESDAGLVAEAYSSGGPLTWTFDLAASGGPEVQILHGTQLSTRFCTDTGAEGTLDQAWLPTAGLVSLTVTPTGKMTDWGEIPATAELQIDGARFHAEGAEDVELESFLIGAGVGWLPG